MATVQEMIEGLGGEEAIQQRFQEFRELIDFFASIQKTLIAQHPNEWVVVTKDRQMVFGESLDDVLAEAEQEGLRSPDILVRHLDPNPQPLFL